MKSINRARRYLLVLISATLGVFALLATFNAFIDPLWIFAHSHSWNRLQVEFNRRVQKVNFLHFTNRDYDSVLLGSSRCVAIREDDFSDMRLFNFSMYLMYPDEYEALLEVFNSTQGPPKNIFIGMDFWASGPRLKNTPRVGAETFLRDAQSPFYVVKSLSSLNTVAYSIRALRLNLDPERERHQSDRNNRSTILPVSLEVRQDNFERKVSGFSEVYYESNYAYQDVDTEVLRRIQKRYPDSKLTVLVTPVSLELYRKFVAAGRFDDYERWLRDLVATAGTVIDMMGVNSFVSEPSNFIDHHHIQADQTHVMAELFQGRGQKEFGQLVTESNISEHIESRRRDAERLADP